LSGHIARNPDEADAMKILTASPLDEVGGVAQWLERRSLAGGLTLIYA